MILTNPKSGKVSLFVDYTAGTETSVTLDFKVAKNGVSYDLLADDNATAVSLSLTGTQKKIYWINTPKDADSIDVGITYVSLNDTASVTLNGDGAATSFSATLQTTVVEGSISIAYTIGGTAYTATDSAGTITGTDLTGTVDYNTGAVSLTFSTAPDASTTITISYSYYVKGTVNIYAGG